MSLPTAPVDRRFNQAEHFERVGRGFCRLTEFPALPHEDVIACVKAGPDRAVVSHDTALALYELAPSRSQGIHLTVPREHRLRRRGGLSGVQVHTTTQPLRPGETVQRFGAQVTSPARTIVDARLRTLARRHAVEAFVLRRQAALERSSVEWKIACAGFPTPSTRRRSKPTQLEPADSAKAGVGRLRAPSAGLFYSHRIDLR